MDQRQPEHDPSIQEFLGWKNSPRTLKSGCRSPDNEVDTAYIPEISLRTWMTTERIVRLLRALFNDDDVSYPSPAYVKEHYLRPFAILLATGFGRMIRHFVDRPHLRDCYMPFSSEPQCFPKSTSQDLFSSFYQQQWQFCPLKLEYDMSHALDNDYILPIVEKTKIGSGGSSTLYKISIDEDYNILTPAGPTYTTPARSKVNIFALKTYRTPAARNYFEDERKAFIKLRYQGLPHPSIIGYYGSFTRGETYNIILEYADEGNLDEYMMNTREPSTISDIMMFWTRFLDVLQGLVHIHGTPGPMSTSHSFLGWHHDLAPDNILVVRKGNVSRFDCDFKIADMGLAHFRRHLESSQLPTDEDRHASNAYSAPEAYRTTALERSRLQVPQSADVFSLGCILSEVVTWVTAGPPQLCEYRRRRSEEAYSISRQTKEALFHWKNRILDTVVQTHQQMLHNSRKNDDVTSNVIHRLIKGMLITDIHARAQASYFLTVGSNILNEAHEALRRVPSGERAPSGVHAASDGIVTVGKRRLPPSLPPNYHHRSLVDPIKVEPSNPNLEGATAQSSSSRSCRQNIPEMLPRHSMPPTSNEEPTEAPLKRWESMSAGSVEGIYLPPNSLVRRPDQTMAQPISPNSAPRHQGRPATSILAQRNPSSMRSGDGHTSKDGYLPATSNLAEESNDMIQWHLSRASTVERTSHSPDVRSFDSSLNNEISALGSVFDASVPVLNSRSSNEPTQNDRPHPYMSVDDGLNVKRERDRGKDSKYPGWDEMKTMDYILRGRDYALLIDNAESMRPHYEKARKVTELLASLTEPYDPNGLDLYFATDAKNYKPKGNRKVLRLFDEHPPKGLADMRARFASILELYQDQFGKSNTLSKILHPKSTPSKGPRRLSLYVLTDGVWDPECTLVTEIKALVTALQKADMPNKHIGIQFIRFGDSPLGIRRLDTLNSGLQLDVNTVDHTSAQGNVWKMLYGPVNDWFHVNPKQRKNPQ